MRTLTLCLLVACLTACGVKRPLHLPGQKKTAWPSAQSGTVMPSGQQQRQDELSGYGIQNNNRTYDPSNPYAPQVK